jgi:eukaryotic-like serine/threonine-protein kinase
MDLPQLGPYRIGRTLGKGGMGSVYEAVDESTGQRVAVKALSPQLAAAEGFRERFEAEIESLKQLQHDGIVRLYGYGEHEGVLFYSMELVEGASLEQEINAGRRFDWQETLTLAIQICRALKHAHDHGIVHRDIKPANLLLDKKDRVKIADFGIARLFGATQLTNAGGILGTADYMSPEQADGGVVTDRCDQYALGCVMFAALAGRPPFRAKTMPEMLQLQRFAEPDPVRRYATETPEQLERLIRQLLSKDPAERFPNALVLARHMEAMQKALSRPKPEEPSEPPPLELRSEDLGSTAEFSTGATKAPLELSPLSLDTTDSGVYDAPTLADDAQAPAPATRGPGGEATRQAPADVGAAAPPRGSRFTTVDEDARRRAAEEGGSHWLLAAQAAMFAAVLGFLGWGAWRLTRPASADDVYGTIAEHVERQGADDLRAVAADVDDFLARFPDDPRASEIRSFAEELELQRLERQLRVRARLRGGQEAQTVASILASATALQESDPARAAQMLEDLLRLFPSTGPAAAELSETHRSYLTLAERQLARLRTQSAEQGKELLPDLQQRLQAAQRLEKSSPADAAAMYRALVDLFQQQPWALPIIDQAEARLELLNENETESR